AYTTATSAPSATSQPSRKSGPFTRARRENRIRITATIAAGLSATPAANVRISLIPRPIRLPGREGRFGRGRVGWRPFEGGAPQPVEAVDGKERDDRGDDDERGNADPRLRDQDERDHDRRERKPQNRCTTSGHQRGDGRRLRKTGQV